MMCERTRPVFYWVYDISYTGIFDIESSRTSAKFPVEKIRAWMISKKSYN